MASEDDVSTTDWGDVSTTDWGDVSMTSRGEGESDQSDESTQSAAAATGRWSRDELRPIERGFPIERVNDLADREGRAKLHYRPLSVMHKWWTRQLGSLVRAITLYTLVDDPEAVTVTEPSTDEPVATDVDTFGDSAEGASDEGDSAEGASDEGGTPDTAALAERIEAVDLESPNELWDLYASDVSVDETSVLDPFAGAGTSLVEAVRFGASVTGIDLNPVATFLADGALDAHRADTDELEAAFETVRDRVADDLQSVYQTQCPNDDSHTAEVVYALWVRCLDCSSCGETVQLFKDYRVASGRYDDSDRDVVYCRACESVFTTDDYETPTVCPGCSAEFTPSRGPVSSGNYGCPSCGLQYPIVEAIADGQSYDDFLYAVEYYCTECDDAGEGRPVYKGYRAATDADRARFEAATQRLADSPDLASYLPTEPIPEGATTTASTVSGNDLFKHGFETWDDLFNERQQYCLATLLSAIDDVSDPDVRRYLLTAFSDSLAFQSRLSVYNPSGGKVESVFRRNSFTPRVEYAENNVWGTRAGRGTFSNTWRKVVDAVEYATAPTERYLQDGETAETAPFDHPVAGDAEVLQADFLSANLDSESDAAIDSESDAAIDSEFDAAIDSEFDVILTHPPYYDNVIYSELSDFYYVWLRQVLADDNPAFQPEHTPREGELVVNPATDTDEQAFERDLAAAFDRIRGRLADDGVVVFTYRHGGSSEWAALVDGLCDAGLAPTAVYPVSADYTAFDDDNPPFTVVVVARPGGDSEPISWPAFRRRLHSIVTETREAVETGQTVSHGDAGVVALGRCLTAYSAHYERVHDGGDRLSTEAVLDRIFDAVGGEVSVTDVYLDLLGMADPTREDVTRLCRGTTVEPADLASRALIGDGDGDGDEPTVADWETPSRVEYIEGLSPDERTPLATVHLARLHHGDPEGPDIDPSGPVLDLAAELAAVTGDETYRAPFRE